MCFCRVLTLLFPLTLTFMVCKCERSCIYVSMTLHSTSHSLKLMRSGS